MLKLSESSWDDEEIEAVISVIKSDAHTMGKHVELFESEFAKWVGSKYAVMVNSGSSANLLAASVLKFNQKNTLRNKVIVPALSWSTTYFPWIQLGYELILLDIDTKSFNIDLKALFNQDLTNVAGICIPHILGADAGIEDIIQFAAKNDLWVVEDTCESLGAQTSNDKQGKKLGTFGNIGTYSFFRSHHISTMEGGMFVTDDYDTYVIAKSMRAHGWTRNIPFSEKISNSDDKSWSSKFKFYVPGFNIRPLETSAAAGLVQIRKLDRFIEIRRKNAAYLCKLISNLKDINLQSQSEIYGSWMAFSFTVKGGEVVRNRLIDELERNGIETRPIVTGDFSKQPVMKRIADRVEIPIECWNAEFVDHSGFMVANHGRDLTIEIEYFAKILNDFFCKGKE